MMRVFVPCLGLALWASGCDLATVPTTASDGLGRPAVAARVMLSIEGLPPAVDGMDIDISSVAIRRTRDEQWLPLVAGTHTIRLSPDAPEADIAIVPLGADTYDRIEILADGIDLQRQGIQYVGQLDREDATLAVQWVLNRDCQLRLNLDYRADVSLSADRLDIAFAPLAELR